MTLLSLLGSLAAFAQDAPPAEDPKPQEGPVVRIPADGDTPVGDPAPAPEVVDPTAPPLPEPGGLAAEIPLLERLDWAPYWEPIAGYQIYNAGRFGTSVFTVGAMVGVRYEDQQSPLVGRTRVAASALLGGGLGVDARLGSFLGPAGKYWSVQAGPDFFYNRYVEGNLSFLPPSPGMDMVVRATLGPEQVYVLGGVSPAILLSPDRRVNWERTDRFGFGHEFEWYVGGVIDTDVFSFALTWRERTISTGVIQSVSFTVGI
ncbi:MAG: hypothetical protein IPO67_11080 [Deltaproteobacteria bacterium]|nr:hypothetical protein [Deltaproteobacteria bacterium]MBK9371364.1 hypothetical protein [Deltaproteobacteria bacterium]MBK9645675.1 hypothetical protein [Deltaproteobacteria bacterium]